MSQLVEEQESNHWKTLSDTYYEYSLHDFKHIKHLHSHHNIILETSMKHLGLSSSVVRIYFHITFKLFAITRENLKFSATR